MDAKVFQKVLNDGIDALPMISGNFTELVRLFQNLLSNAIKYVDADTTPQVSVCVLSQENGAVEIAVSDNGIGFEQQHAEQIFEPFQRLHGRSKEFEGSGIEVASCRQVVEHHAGSIRAKSAPGEGSTFIVSLPLDAKAAAARTPSNFGSW